MNNNCNLHLNVYLEAESATLLNDANSYATRFPLSMGNSNLWQLLWFICPDSAFSYLIGTTCIQIRLLQLEFDPCWESWVARPSQTWLRPFKHNWIWVQPWLATWFKVEYLWKHNHPFQVLSSADIFSVQVNLMNKQESPLC